jgi:beta-lactam-binding protein with PASTA domain
MSGIFISYRRADSQSAAGRLADDLKERLPEAAIFRDVETIGLGVDFVDEINRALAPCGVLLAVIGPRWLSVTGPDGKRRLDDPGDFTRLEIATGLKRSDVRVIPVLVEGAVMPSAADLPDDLKPLARRNAVELTDKRWQYDVGAVEATVREALGLAKPTPEPGITKRMPWGLLAGGASVLALVGMVYVGMNDGGPDKGSGTGSGPIEHDTLAERLAVVPRVVGLPFATAQREIAAAHLDVAEPVRQPTSETAPDTVLEQSPAPGTRIAVGEAVRLTVASTEAPVRAPNLSGLDLERAIEQLVLAGLKPGEKHLAPRAGPRDKANRVFSQTPDPDQELARGSRVDLWLWGDAVVMPNVIGYETRKARLSLESYGLRSEVKYAEIDTVKAGVVIDQNPEGDTEQPGREVVTLTVAKTKPAGSTAPTVTLNPKVLEVLKSRKLMVQPAPVAAPASAATIRVNPDLLIRREIVQP